MLAEYERLLEERDHVAFKRWLLDLHPSDIADLIDASDISHAAVLFRMLPKDDAVDVFSYLEPEAQAALIQGFSDQEVSHMVEKLYTDDAVDMLEELPANVVSRVLRLATPETRATFNHYLKYPEDSAGSIMTSEYVRLKGDMNVGQAIEWIRKTGHDRETIYTCYITTPDRKLEGVTSVRTLLLAPDGAIVRDIMDEQVIHAHTTDDQEDIVHLFSDYDLIALPVVDSENRLVGIITFDDILDVSREEATEDFERMAAMSPSERPYLKTSVWTQAKNRFGWLLVLMLSGMINGSILQRYDHAFLAIPILVSFIPMLTDTGGNAGSQSSTMIIRGMALSELEARDWPSILWKEIRISLMVGIVLGIINFVRIYFTMGRDAGISATVSITFVAVVLMANTLGSMLPILARKFKMDPAIMAAPLITTIVDAGALIVFFKVAEAILHI